LLIEHRDAHPRRAATFFNSSGLLARVLSAAGTGWFMLLVTSNKSKQLLYVSYIGRVRLEEFQRNREDFVTQLGEMSPGFRLLADFSQLESMEPDCSSELGRMMDLVGQAGVGQVVRVIPDPGKDIGMNILTIFHYPHHRRPVTCETVADAAGLLAL
jgi:hypothetical protein